MTGTLADAAICLLLVSAAAVVATTADRSRPTATTPDETLTTLATVTDRVTYAVTDDRNRTRHGTIAELLARGAVADAVGDTPQVRAVRAATRAVVGPRVRVVARWRPAPGAPIAGRVTVGPEPPAGPVRAGRFVVPFAVADCDANLTTHAARVAATILRVTIPPERRALARAGAVNAIRHRLTRLATAYDAEGGKLSVRTAIDRLQRAITTHVRRSPDEHTPGRVTVVVRTW